MNASRIDGVMSFAALSAFAFPAFGATISGSQVNLYVGDEYPIFGSFGQKELTLYEEAGLTTIYSGVEYPVYGVASHDIGQVVPAVGSISFQTDNSPRTATNAWFNGCCGFNGFIYEFPMLSITSARLSNTNKPDLFSDLRIVLFSPTLNWVHAAGND